MSTLRVANLQSTAGTQTVTQDRLYRGAATAWVNWNGTGTVAIRDSYNVSSITDVGTGNYTINLQSALANANYCPVGLADASGSKVSVYGTTGGTWPNSSSQLQVTIATSGSSTPLSDAYAVTVAIFGGY